MTAERMTDAEIDALLAQMEADHVDCEMDCIGKREIAALRQVREENRALREVVEDHRRECSWFRIQQEEALTALAGEAVTNG